MRRVDLARPLGIAAFVGATLLVIGHADAERVRTTDTVKVYRDSGEQSGVITKVAEGTTLTVLKTDGRWLKVRVNGRPGLAGHARQHTQRKGQSMAPHPRNPPHVTLHAQNLTCKDPVPLTR